MNSDPLLRPEQRARADVAVLSAASGYGHLRAADALVSALGREALVAAHVDALQHASALLRWLYAEYYVETVNRRPWLLGAAYAMMARPRRFRRSRLLFDLLQTRPLVALLRDSNARVVLCTHFLPAEIAVHLRRTGVLGCRIGVVMTDFDVHPLWAYPDADWYFVAGDDARKSAIRLGIPASRIHVTGIPIERSFDAGQQRRDARLRMGLNPDLATLLVAAGGFGMGPIEALAAALQRVRAPVQLVVLCGRNDALRRRLAACAATHPTTVVGHTDQMAGWMAAADVLVGKAGGLTCAEALAGGVVSILVNPIPGPEESNAAILMKEGAAMRCHDVDSLAAAVDRLLGDEEGLTRMRQAVARIARPEAAARIAALVARSLRGE